MTDFLQIILLFSCFLSIISSSSSFETLASWVSIQYDWQSPSQRSLYLSSKLYIPENNAIAGIKCYKNDIFLTVPRWLRGVPSTLNKLKLNKNGEYVLSPFPNWASNDLKSDFGLKYVQSMEIDTKGRMWIIDVGRLNIIDKPETVINGPAKIVILDINTKKVIKFLVLSEEIAPYNASFLNDIVIDEKRGFAYISDTSGAIIIYNFEKNIAKRWSSDTMKNEQDLNLTINGVSYGNSVFTTAIDGIALSDNGNNLFFCALQGIHLFTINTDLLRDFDVSDEVLEKNVMNLGRKRDVSDGMTTSKGDFLYFGGLMTDSVYKWDMKKEFNEENQEILAKDVKKLHWVDTFAWRKDGELLVVTNKLDLFFTKKMDFTGKSGKNFRILKIKAE